MDRIRWSERSVPFQAFVDNPSIQKPALVQIGSKAIVIGEKINGEFMLASPCKVSGDRFDVMEQEIVLSSKHTGVWRVISKATSKKEGHIHRLTTKDLERIHKQDVRNERTAPRSYICIRDVEAFELIPGNKDAAILNGHRVERRIKQIEEDVEFEIVDTGEVEYTPSEGERTTQDYLMVQKKLQGAFLQLLLPGVMEEERLIRNRVLRALHCRTIGESRKRHFVLEVNEQPCEIRPVASEGSTELRYLHSTQNLFDYMLTYGNDTMLYVKLLRGDPPIKAIEFDGYMVLKNTLKGDRIPICRVEDLEITLVSPELPVKVRSPTKSEHVWRSLSEVRAAEVQCMQFSLALLARHESEMYVSIEGEKSSSNYLQSHYNRQQRPYKSGQSSDAMKKHIEECEKIFGEETKPSSKYKAKPDLDYRSSHSTERQLSNLMLSAKPSSSSSSTPTSRYIGSSNVSKDTPAKTTSVSFHPASDRYYRSTNHGKSDQPYTYDRSQGTVPRQTSILSSSAKYKKTNAT